MNSEDNHTSTGSYIPLGMCFGLIFGLLLGHLAMGLALGLILGVTAGAWKEVRHRRPGARVALAISLAGLAAVLGLWIWSGLT